MSLMLVPEYIARGGGKTLWGVLLQIINNNNNTIQTQISLSQKSQDPTGSPRLALLVPHE
jgi:hypothetical protein